MDKTVKFAVSGMGCQGCVQTVTAKLRAAPGVKDVKVTLSPPEAVVSYDPAVATLEGLMDSSAKAGYVLTLSAGAVGG